MRMTYDREIDALYIVLADAPVADSVDYAEGITAELDANGRVVALEILDLHRHLDEGEQLLEALEREAEATSAA
jgi:uncharacterized protein YuzE